MWKSLVTHRAPVRWQSGRGIFGFNKRKEEESPDVEELKPTEVAEEVGKEYEKVEVKRIPVPKSASECLENEELIEIVSTHVGSKLDPHQLEMKTLDPSKLRVDVLAHFRTSYDVLFPSNVFPALRTVGDAADYVVAQLHPPSTLLDQIKAKAPSNVRYLHKEHKPRTGVKEDRKRGEAISWNRSYRRVEDVDTI
eukprot:CAMPEP_0184745964 /NCGR_PEP_ID=MMETSP0315-20130426/8577_1 /TAXON_ID=101924 /ORGANISM="Rhodosorus marinus, Strain UTEX LB 2760" /LENGTH=194 /DNA_ID=CAMNT_0027218339 /DNA_START=117 /DNA_END=701 /DNA_ORIENTATION=-